MMTRSVQPSAAAVLTAAEPVLFVADVAASCAYFAEKLGFSERFRYGTPPFYAQVGRDGAAFNLRHVDAPPFDQATRERDELLSAAFTVAGAAELERLHREFAHAGASFFRPLRVQPWGARDFVVRDPDGNLLLFAAPAI